MSGSIRKMIEHEENLAAAKMGGAVGFASLYGLTLNEWVAAITIGYLLLQIGLLIPKYVRLYKAWRANKLTEIE